MKKSLKAVLGNIFMVSAIALGAHAHASENYPDKVVTIVVPFAAGGPTDTSARVIANSLADELGVPFVVENVPGAGGTIGTARTAKATPDGYTLLWGTGSGLSILPHLRNLPYDPQQSFEPISMVLSAPFVLAVSPKLDVEELDDFLQLVKSKPGQLNYGSTGVGGTVHMIGEMLNIRAGTETVHVPYNGGAPMMHALLSGSVEYAFDTPSGIIPLAQTDKVVPLAVTGLTRWPALPDVKTLDESGYTGFDATTWFGLLAPAGTSQEHIKVLSESIAKILKKDDIRKTLEQTGFFVEGSTPAEFSTKIEQDNQQWSDTIKQANISLDE